MNTQKNPWYIRVLKENLQKYSIKYYFVLPALLFSAILMSQIFIFNSTFEWVTIKPIAAIGLGGRLLSAIAFVTIGRVLYYLSFYYFLSRFFRGVLNDHSAYIKTKKYIWYGLMFISFFYIAPFFIGIINSALSFIYNITVFIMYLFPAMSITVSICGIYIVLDSYNTTRTLEVQK